MPKSHFTDVTLDTVEQLTSTCTTRTGFAASRLAVAKANGISTKVLALMLTENADRNGADVSTPFTPEDVEAVIKFFYANRTRSVLTKSQVRALSRASDIELFPVRA
jgi:hypothetical protein